MSTVRRLSWAFAVALLGAAGCGGGSSSEPVSSSSASGVSPSGAPVAGPHTVVLEVVDARGAAVPGARATLAGVGAATTDAQGRVTFTRVPGGSRALSVDDAWGAGFYPYGTSIDAAQTTTARFALEAVRTVAIVAARMVPTNADYTRGRVTLDVVVLAPDGTFDASLAPTQFRFDLPCPMGCDGGVDNLDVEVWQDGPTALTLLPAGVARRVAVGALVDDSAAMGDWDRAKLRVPALRQFATALAGQPVALGTFREAAGAVVTPVLPFTTDATVLASAIGSLGSAPGGGVALYTAVSEMAAYAAARWPADHARSLVVLTAEADRCDLNSGLTQDCRSRRDAAVRDAQAAGASVWVVSASRWASEVSALAGGGYVKVEGPQRYAQALAALPRLLDGSTMRYRLEFDLRSPEGPVAVFRPGGMLLGYLTLSFPPGSSDSVPLAVPITAR